jgi:hypothetical protein
VFVDPAMEGWPHAPWLVPEAGVASPICTGLLAGTLHAAAAVTGGAQADGAAAQPWLSQATELLWARIDSLSLADIGPYDMRALFWFLDHVPDRDRAAAAMEKIGPMIFDGGMVALDPETPGEVHFALDFAPLPGSMARRLFDPEVIEAGLDHLAAAQQPDGCWTFNWMAWSPAAALEWRGHMTVEALRTLQANGRL